MKSTRFHIISLAFFLFLAACRTERKTEGNTLREHTEPGSVSHSPPLQREQLGGSQSTAGNPDSPIKAPPIPRERELSSDEILLRNAELQRAAVFSIAVSTQAAKDRVEAWEKLTTAEPHRLLTKEQYLYAQELLERYREAPVMEKLVFWRLLYLRLNEQGVSSSSRIVGDDYLDLRRGIYPKLKAMLYSALGEDPEKLPEFRAIQKGMETLKAASAEGSLFEY